jgi:spore coat protein H
LGIKYSLLKWLQIGAGFRFTQFNEEDGTYTPHCYKPDGNGASWASSNFSTVDFGKKNNKATDWSDVQAVYEALHASTRTTDTTQYKADLEAVFNVDLFLKWLAANVTMQNWDTYGRMTHNYYLYNHPTNGMSWIPWDNNEAFEEGKQGGRCLLN